MNAPDPATAGKIPVRVRETRQEDFAGIIRMCEQVYRGMPPWREDQLASQRAVFPEGQLVAVDTDGGAILGFAASLIILWDDYAAQGAWRGFTAQGTFANHDPVQGRTLYGAEIMTLPSVQGRGVGSALYGARQALAERLGLLRIRAGARLRGYSAWADRLSPIDYVLAVLRGELRDPTLSFQLARGFHVIDVVPGYLRHDPESLGYAATIQWINRAVAKPSDFGTAHPALEPFAPKP